MKTVKEMVSLLQESSNKTTEEDLREWAESIIDQCMQVGWDNRNMLGGDIWDKVKEIKTKL